MDETRPEGKRDANDKKRINKKERNTKEISRLHYTEQLSTHSQYSSYPWRQLLDPSIHRNWKRYWDGLELQMAGRRSPRSTYPIQATLPLG